ncbi:MAG: four helix bundle protein [Ignavibacteriae bacterium]|nr:four helix bundle protein [Ignavibacteriota bacterium]MCB9219781.1 four helix bundle protein [Ignavibacteriales bacterium]
MSNRFEDLEIWKRSVKLSIDVYKNFEDLKDFGFKDQITRSALSIPSNIAEGFERESNKEFIHFLQFAKGSCGELRTQLFIGIEIDYIQSEIGKKLFTEAEEISYMLNAFIKKRKTF